MEEIMHIEIQLFWETAPELNMFFSLVEVCHKQSKENVVSTL